MDIEGQSFVGTVITIHFIKYQKMLKLYVISIFDIIAYDIILNKLKCYIGLNTLMILLSLNLLVFPRRNKIIDNIFWCKIKFALICI